MTKTRIPKSPHLTDLEITFDWPDKGWLIHEGKLVEVGEEGDNGEACLTAAVSPDIDGNQIFWDKEVAEDVLWRSLHPVEAAWKDYQEKKITQNELVYLVGEVKMNELMNRG